MVWLNLRRIAQWLVPKGRMCQLFVLLLHDGCCGACSALYIWQKVPTLQIIRGSLLLKTCVSRSIDLVSVPYMRIVLNTELRGVVLDLKSDISALGQLIMFSK